MDDLDTNPPPTSYLDVPRQLVLDAAEGMLTWAELAAKHRLSAALVARLRDYEPFKRAVDVQRSELRASGATFRLKARVMAEDLLEKLYMRVANPDVPAALLLDAHKHFAKMADLDPKPSAPAPTGNGFTIVIDLSGAPTPARPPAPAQPPTPLTLDADSHLPASHMSRAFHAHPLDA